jgi:hypothetical protein
LAGEEELAAKFAFCRYFKLPYLPLFQALVSCSHTIITDWETWQHLGVLLFIGGVSSVFVINTGMYKSIGESNPVLTRISLLISFILSGYITITVNRWDRIRNVTLGKNYLVWCLFSGALRLFAR